MSTFETTPAAAGAPAIPPYSTAEMRSYPLGTLVYRAGLMSLDEVNRALAEAAASGRRLGEVLPTQPATGPVYRIEVTLESGTTLLVAEATDFEEAKAIGMRVIDESEAGGMVAIGDATIDGRQVVSVDVLGRNG